MSFNVPGVLMFTRGAFGLWMGQTVDLHGFRATFRSTRLPCVCTHPSIDSFGQDNVDAWFVHMSSLHSCHCYAKQSQNGFLKVFKTRFFDGRRLQVPWRNQNIHFGVPPFMEAFKCSSWFSLQTLAVANRLLRRLVELRLPELGGENRGSKSPCAHGRSGGFHSHGSTPIAGWFISWKIHLLTGMMTGGGCILGNPHNTRVVWRLNKWTIFIIFLNRCHLTRNCFIFWNAVLLIGPYGFWLFMRHVSEHIGSDGYICMHAHICTYT